MIKKLKELYNRIKGVLAAPADTQYLINGRIRCKTIEIPFVVFGVGSVVYYVDNNTVLKGEIIQYVIRAERLRKEPYIVYYLIATESTEKKYYVDDVSSEKVFPTADLAKEYLISQLNKRIKALRETEKITHQK